MRPQRAGDWDEDVGRGKTRDPLGLEQTAACPAGRQGPVYEETV